MIWCYRCPFEIQLIPCMTEFQGPQMAARRRPKPFLDFYALSPSLQRFFSLSGQKGHSLLWPDLAVLSSANLSLRGSVNPAPWGALHKIGRFRNVPTLGTNLENGTFGVPWNDLFSQFHTYCRYVSKRPILYNAPLAISSHRCAFHATPPRELCTPE